MVGFLLEEPLVGGAIPAWVEPFAAAVVAAAVAWVVELDAAAALAVAAVWGARLVEAEASAAAWAGVEVEGVGLICG